MTENSLLIPMTTLFVDVVLPLSVPGTYTYRVPMEMNEEMIEGMRVVVPFGKTKLYVGIVLNIHEKAPAEYTAKYVLHVLDMMPILNSVQLKFWKWISSYYMCYPGEVMKAALPAGLKMQSETRIGLHPEGELEGIELDDKESAILEALQHSGEMSPETLSTATGVKNIFKYLKSLYERGLILFLEELEDTYKPLTILKIEIHPDYRNDERMGDAFDQLEKKAPAQLMVLMRLISTIKLDGSIEKQDLLALEGVTSAALKSLVKKQILLEKKIEKGRIDLGGDMPETTAALSAEQLNAYQNIQEHFKQDKIVFLHGVTSSGKTHVYLQLIEDTLNQGKQVLYLVPEIALTTQLISRVKQRFGNRVIVSHSRFNAHEKVELWNAIAEQKADILLGPRSAVFLPFKNLGLVIVDEEHESAYKQYDPNPRYHGRDAALMLGHLSGANCLLGSATPSIETFTHAKSGKYALVALKERFGGIELPEMLPVDMKEEKRTKRVNGLYSFTLLEAIDEALKQEEQIILFLNRKGYVPVTECAECAWTPMCINCDISLTYYKSGNNLRCHYCGFHREPVNRCPACGSTHILMSGYGTERAEDELKTLYPDVSIGRFDYDTTRTKHAFEQIIHAFSEGKIKILIGTQMVAKGLDFNNVRLVGILHADQMLNYPDFRSAEKAYQMMVQVSGRAGRRSTRGKVLIQTHRPDHPVIAEVLEQDYPTFYAREIAEREKFKYPPFYRLIRLTCRHKNADVLFQASELLYDKLNGLLGNQVHRPQKPPVSRIKNFFLKEILIKLEADHKETALTKLKIRRMIHQMVEMKEFKSVYVHADVDPY